MSEIKLPDVWSIAVAWECASLSSHFNQFGSRLMQKACEATPIAEQKTSALVRRT
jgi:hypothetical protein